MEKSIFLAQGRISRGIFWIRYLIAMIIFGVSFILGRSQSPILMLLSSLLTIITYIFVIIQGIKRMHDVDKSGWFILIPLYNLILCFTAGTTGANQYGEDPKGIN